jgi:sigma-B regulation protein RsbU (phosphoserine phosphatase)
MVLGTPFASITIGGASSSTVGTWTDARSPADQHRLAEPELCQRVAESGETLIIDDRRPQLASGAGRRKTADGAAAWAGIALVGPSGDAIGAVCVADHLPRHWSDSDMDVLAALAHVASGEMALRAAIEQHADELAPAGNRPAVRMPEIPGLQVAARCLAGQPAAERGAIFYDAFPVGQAGWGLVVGEVYGQARPVGRSTTLARYTLRAYGHDMSSPSAILAGLNQAILRWPAADRQQLAVICAVVRPVLAGAIVRVCSAGRAGALLRRASGNVQSLGRPAPALGVNADPGLRDSRRVLRSGDSLVLASDSVIDSRDQRDEGRFGESQLSKVVTGLGAASAARAAEAVLRAAAEFSGDRLGADCVALVLKVPRNRPGSGTHAAAWPGTHAYPTLGS